MYIFLSNHGPFQYYLYKLGKRPSQAPLRLWRIINITPLHSVVDIYGTLPYKIKHRNMTLKCWLTYLLERPTLIKKNNNLHEISGTK